MQSNKYKAKQIDMDDLVSNFQSYLDSHPSNKSYFIPDISVSTQSASYTLVLSDNKKLIQFNVASANTLTIPLNSSVAFQIGTKIMISQIGAGQTSIVATAGVIINSADSALKLRTQYSTATLIKTNTDTWLLIGDISV